MYDPYQALGVSRSATEEEIKKAYRSLSRKYHPDANVNNPNKEHAEEKFKEIQQAYQQIMQERERGTSGGYGQSSSGGQGSYGGQGGFGGSYWDFGDFFGGFGGFGGSQGRNRDAGGNGESAYHQAASNYIRSGHYKEAVNVLNSMKDRDARWHYLSAIANSGLGNNVAAMEAAQRAVSMEPGNQEYQQLYAQLQNGGSWYYDRRQSYGSPIVGSGDFCMKLCLANLACNFCCGGGFCCGGVPYC